MAAAILPTPSSQIESPTVNCWDHRIVEKRSRARFDPFKTCSEDLASSRFRKATANLIFRSVLLAVISPPVLRQLDVHRQTGL